jgi:hypothetical protein
VFGLYSGSNDSTFIYSIWSNRSSSLMINIICPLPKWFGDGPDEFILFRRKKWGAWISFRFLNQPCWSLYWSRETVSVSALCFNEKSQVLKHDGITLQLAFIAAYIFAFTLQWFWSCCCLWLLFWIHPPLLLFQSELSIFLGDKIHLVSAKACHQ